MRASEVLESSFAVCFRRTYSFLDAEMFIQWVNAHIPEITRVGLGVPITTGMELLNLPPFENQSFLKWMGTNLFMVLDKNGKCSRRLSRIQHRQAEMGSRWFGYDNFIANARPGTPPSEAFVSSSYMQLLLKPGYTFHIRPVLKIEHTILSRLRDVL
jgi:hypothetical protein